MSEVWGWIKSKHQFGYSTRKTTKFICTVKKQGRTGLKIATQNIEQFSNPGLQNFAEGGRGISKDYEGFNSDSRRETDCVTDRGSERDNLGRKSGD